MIDSYAVALAALLMGLVSLADLRGRLWVHPAGGGRVRGRVAGQRPGRGVPARLIAARGVQGVGGAAMFATTIAR